MVPVLMLILCLLMFLAGVVVGLWAVRGETKASRELADRSLIFQEHASRNESLARETREQVEKMDETLGSVAELLRGVIRAVVPRELRSAVPEAAGTQRPEPPPAAWTQTVTPMPEPRSSGASRRASVPAQS